MDSEKGSKQKKRVRSFAYFESYYRARSKLKTYKERALFDDIILDFFFAGKEPPDFDKLSNNLALALELAWPTVEKSKQRSEAGKTQPSMYEMVEQIAKNQEEIGKKQKQIEERLKNQKSGGSKPVNFPERDGYDYEALEEQYRRN